MDYSPNHNPHDAFAAPGDVLITCEDCGRSWGESRMVHFQRAMRDASSSVVNWRDGNKVADCLSSYYCEVRAAVASRFDTSTEDNATRAAILLGDNCPGVRAALVANVHMNFTQPADFLDEEYPVRKALWGRTDLPDDVRERLAEEFA